MIHCIIVFFYCSRPGSGRRPRVVDQLSNHDLQTRDKVLGPMSLGRQEAFEIFRRDYHSNQSIEDNKKVSTCPRM